MLKRGNLVLLLFSVALALVTTLVIERQLNHYKLEHQTVVQMKQVVVVKKNVGIHQQVSINDVGVEEVPASAVEPGTASQISQVAGMYTKTDWIPNQQVVAGMYGDGKTVAFSITIPRGYRAFTIPNSAITGVDHFVQPGDHVDILISDSSSKNTMSLQDILVLYADQVQTLSNTPNNNSSGKSGGADTLTLAVTPQQAQELAVQGSNGQIHIALRNPSD